MNPLRSYALSASSHNPTESMTRLQAFSPSFSPPTRLYDQTAGRNLHSPPALNTPMGFESSRFTTPLARSMHAPSTSGPSSSLDGSRFSPRREGRHFSPSRISPPYSEFHPRLYPGSVRHAARTMSVSKPSFPLGPTSVFEPNWRKPTEVESKRDLEEEQQQQSESSTPVVERPVEFSLSHSQFQVHSSGTSPSLATTSSPTFSALAHSPESGLNDVCTCFFSLCLYLSLFIERFSQRLGRPRLRPPIRHHFMVRHIRLLLAGEYPRCRV